MPETKGADRIEKWPIERLRGYKKNSRTHSEDQITKIAASIAEFGFTNPVLAKADGELIAGHGRVMAAQRLGIGIVPVIVLDYLTDAQRRAYIIADNQLATLAGWDDGILQAELRDLMAEGFDLNLVGFESAELDRLLMGEQEEEDEGGDFVPEVEEVPVSQIGDVWILGDHRIICGDSTSEQAIERLLAGAVPHLMVTDPPYGVEYDPSWREGADLGVGNRSKGKVLNDDRVDWYDAWALFPGDVAYVWHAGKYSAEVQRSLEGAEFQVRSQIIWAKQHFAMSRGDYHWMHEPCWYAVRKGKTGHWSGDRKQTTVWQIANNNSFGNSEKEETWGHGTLNPLECMLRPILNNSQRGDAVYEPFSGSGTTIIAAEKSGRRCYAIELNPLYVDVAVRRWEKFTNKKAVHADTKRTFAEMQAERT